MSWPLSSQLRRIIAGLLLLLDLGLEPGSAISYVDLEDEAQEAVADLCRRADIWGRDCSLRPGASYAISLAGGPEPRISNKDEGRTQAAVTAVNVGPSVYCLTSPPANPGAVALPDMPQAAVMRRPWLAFGAHVLRNSTLAHKRVTVLIV